MLHGYSELISWPSRVYLSMCTSVSAPSRWCLQFWPVLPLWALPLPHRAMPHSMTGRLQLGSKTCDCSLVLSLRDSSVLNSEFFFRRVPTALLVIYSDTVGFCYDRRNHCLTIHGAAEFEAHVIPGFILKLGLPVLSLLRPGLPFQ